MHNKHIDNEQNKQNQTFFHLHLSVGAHTLIKNSFDLIAPNCNVSWVVDIDMSSENGSTIFNARLCTFWFYPKNKLTKVLRVLQREHNRGEQ